MTATYPDLVALRRPEADHGDLPTAILRVVRRPPEPAPVSKVRPVGYRGEHRAGRDAR